ncbi:MAG: hypothetical protein AAGB04_14720 [Pseudomonadota bacterium]
MRYTILLQSLVALLLLVTATTAGNAVAYDLVQHEISQETGAPQVSSCLKLKTPERHKKKCNGSTTSAPTSSRPRSPSEPELAEIAAAVPVPRPENTPEIVDSLTRPPDMQHASRRAVFWHVFAYSARLRG